MIWTVILPKNNGVETEEIKEGFYTFTRITILNAKGWTKVIWGFASKFYPYDVPKLCFVYEPDGHRTVPPPSGTPSDLEGWYWLPCGDLEGSGSWIQW